MVDKTLTIQRQGSPHLVKTGRLDFSLSWLKGEVRENLKDFRKSIQILTFLSLLLHVPLPCTKTNNDLKRMQLTSLKYWTSNPVWVTFQEHGSSFNVNIEEKVWLLVKKIRTWKEWRLKLRFLTEIGRLHWKQGKEVAHFAWFGEPCRGELMCSWRIGRSCSQLHPSCFCV